jgi:hypothetical protein
MQIIAARASTVPTPDGTVLISITTDGEVGNLKIDGRTYLLDPMELHNMDDLTFRLCNERVDVYQEVIRLLKEMSQ